ncbi:hypothetical protein HDV00_007274 [Rhizophlyctis rosea]|nr:hypothetical protein HDV00_007274 [Rhizophlyctis rosea]
MVGGRPSTRSRPTAQLRPLTSTYAPPPTNTLQKNDDPDTSDHSSNEEVSSPTTRKNPGPATFESTKATPRKGTHKTTKTDEQLHILKKAFSEDQNPSKEKKAELAARTGLSVSQVRGWLAYERKKKAAEVTMQHEDQAQQQQQQQQPTTASDGAVVLASDEEFAAVGGKLVGKQAKQCKEEDEEVWTTVHPAAELKHEPRGKGMDIAALVASPAAQDAHPHAETVGSHSPTVTIDSVLNGPPPPEMSTSPWTAASATDKFNHDMSNNVRELPRIELEYSLSDRARCRGCESLIKFNIPRIAVEEPPEEWAWWSHWQRKFWHVGCYAVHLPTCVQSVDDVPGAENLEENDRMAVDAIIKQAKGIPTVDPVGSLPSGQGSFSDAFKDCDPVPVSTFEGCGGSSLAPIDSAFSSPTGGLGVVQGPPFDNQPTAPVSYAQAYARHSIPPAIHSSSSHAYASIPRQLAMWSQAGMPRPLQPHPCPITAQPLPTHPTPHYSPVVHPLTFLSFTVHNWHRVHSPLTPITTYICPHTRTLHAIFTDTTVTPYRLRFTAPLPTLSSISAIRTSRDGAYVELEIKFRVPPVCEMEVADGAWIQCGDFTEGGVVERCGGKWVVTGCWTVLREELEVLCGVDGCFRAAMVEGSGRLWCIEKSGGENGSSGCTDEACCQGQCGGQDEVVGK